MANSISAQCPALMAFLGTPAPPVKAQVVKPEPPSIAVRRFQHHKTMLVQRQEASIVLPNRKVIYWLQANFPDDDILPGPGASYKLACSTVVLCRSEILTRWPDRQHVFVTVKFDDLTIKKARLLAAA